MPDPVAAFDAFAVERSIQAAAPAVLFASPRLVRRVIDSVPARNLLDGDD